MSTQLLSVTEFMVSKNASILDFDVLVSVKSSFSERFERNLSAYSFALDNICAFTSRENIGVSERPLCFTPKKSPAPRISKSTSARYCPSLDFSSV